MLRPLLQSVLERGLKGAFGKQLEGIDLQALIAAGRMLVEQQPRTFHELGKMLQEQWPSYDPAALSAAVRTWVPLSFKYLLAVCGAKAGRLCIRHPNNGFNAPSPRMRQLKS